MPFTTVLIVTAIVAAFTLFGLVLAWGDYQTRNINRGKAEAEAETKAARAAANSNQAARQAA